MKCENCGKNEVTFIYHSNINGRVEEKHLCSACAKQMGYMKELERSCALQQNLWKNSLLTGGFFDSFFSPSVQWELPFQGLFGTMPALTETPSQQKAEAARDLMDEKEQTRFANMRKLNALRAEMKKAVREEAFERAAQLRDEIRALEQSKESA